MNQFINTVTLGEPKRLLPSLLWSCATAALKGLPFLFLLTALWLFFEPLQAGEEPNLTAVLGLCGAMVLSLIIHFFVDRRTHLHANCDTYDLVADGRVRLGDHLRRLSMGFFRGNDPGDVAAVLLQDYQNIELAISHCLPSVVSAVVVPALALVSLSFLDWKMALIAAAVLPLAIPTLIISRSIGKRIGRDYMSSKATLSSRTVDFVTGFKAIKAFSMERQMLAELEDTFEDFRKQSVSLEGAIAPILSFGGFFVQAGFVAILLSGLSFLFKEQLSLFAFFAFLIVGGRLYDAFSTALVHYALLNFLALSVDNVEKTLAYEPLREPTSAPKPQESTIRFDNVTFSYGDIPVLKGVSFTAPCNGITALVGPSGSGKTTITRLIARFWDVQEGTISLGGIPLEGLRSEELLSHMSMVFQEVYLFNESIMENIRMGREEATDGEVIEAARRAQCHDFISALPDGYGTIAGEGGCRLSGGEKQRISIARALLKDAPIVLLDEATASLDPENEYQIQQALSELVEGKTLIIIAHRLKTVVGADQILVLDGGEIVERGTHAELLQSGALYGDLWAKQQSCNGWRFKERDENKKPTTEEVR